jgi:hypothetical protein
MSDCPEKTRQMSPPIIAPVPSEKLTGDREEFLERFEGDVAGACAQNSRLWAMKGNCGAVGIDPAQR